MSATDLAVERLKVAEGFRSAPYKDIVGKTTLGYGFNVEAGITQYAALALLDAQATEVAFDLAKQDWYVTLDDVRKSVCIELAFNLGLAGFLAFHDTIQALRSGNWQGAHDELLDSKAAQQLPARYARLAQILLTGVNDA